MVSCLKQSAVLPPSGPGTHTCYTFTSDNPLLKDSARPAVAFRNQHGCSSYSQCIPLPSCNKALACTCRPAKRHAHARRGAGTLTRSLMQVGVQQHAWGVEFQELPCYCCVWHLQFRAHGYCSSGWSCGIPYQCAQTSTTARVLREGRGSNFYNYGVTAQQLDRYPHAKHL